MRGENTPWNVFLVIALGGEVMELPGSRGNSGWDWVAWSTWLHIDAPSCIQSIDRVQLIVRWSARAVVGCDRFQDSDSRTPGVPSPSVAAAAEITWRRQRGQLGATRTVISRLRRRPARLSYQASDWLPLNRQRRRWDQLEQLFQDLERLRH